MAAKSNRPVNPGRGQYSGRGSSPSAGGATGSTRSGGASSARKVTPQQRKQSAAARTYITKDGSRVEAGRQAAQTRAENIERSARLREGAAHQRGSKSGFRKGSVAGGVAGAGAGGVAAAGAVEQKKPSSSTNTSVPAKRTGGRGKTRPKK